jgi:hypothetical protein
MLTLIVTRCNSSYLTRKTILPLNRPQGRKSIEEERLAQNAICDLK